MTNVYALYKIYTVKCLSGAVEEAVCSSLNVDMTYICQDHEECELQDNLNCTKKQRITAVTGAVEEAFCNSLNAVMKSTCEDHEACKLQWSFGKTQVNCVRKTFYKKSVSKPLKRKIENSKRIEKLFFKQKNTTVTVSAPKE